MAHSWYGKNGQQLFLWKQVNFFLIKREVSNQKDTSGRWKKWGLLGNILQKCLV